jgi:hypothetical protein
MAIPDWYGDWRHSAIHELEEKNARLWEEFQLGACSRYEYDFDSERLFFLKGGTVQVVAEIQVAGSTSGRAKNWLWAWGNNHYVESLTVFSRNARTFGEANSIPELTNDIVEADDLNGLGWALTAATARLSGALGAYRPPREDGGGLYLIYKSMNWAN